MTVVRQFESFGDYVRFQAVAHASLAESIEQGRRQISEVVERLTASNMARGSVVEVQSLADVLKGLDEGAQRMKLVSSLSAAQAVAWDHMQAKGGPGNPEAYGDYGAATEFHRDLLASTPPPSSITDDDDRN